MDDPRTAQLEVLNEVARIATLDVELRPMLKRITDTLASKFDWEFVALVTLDHQRDVFMCEAVTSSVATDIHVGYTRPLGSGVVGHVAATGEPAIVDDVRAWPNYVETMAGAQAEICVPVRHHGQTIAVLNIESTRPAAFHEQLPLLTTVADQIAGAIHMASVNARLAETTRLLELKTRALEDANEHLAGAIETLHRISTQDGLTGVANRRHLDETLAVEWRRAARKATPIALLLLDIDFFKDFNDASGHQAGDDCLRRVAEALRQCVHRAADLVARYGGEEFAVLLPDTAVEDARTMAESLRQHIEDLGLVTASIGVAGIIPPRDGTGLEDLIGRADAALYEAKRAGRNTVV
jgi:diguanylate cyclase (GGDEF)-like protein